MFKRENGLLYSPSLQGYGIRRLEGVLNTFPYTCFSGGQKVSNTALHECCLLFEDRSCMHYILKNISCGCPALDLLAMSSNAKMYPKLLQDSIWFLYITFNTKHEIKFQKGGKLGAISILWSSTFPLCAVGIHGYVGISILPFTGCTDDNVRCKPSVIVVRDEC